jgi:hypothetical protein
MAQKFSFFSRHIFFFHFGKKKRWQKAKGLEQDNPTS